MFTTLFGGNVTTFLPTKVQQKMHIRKKSEKKLLENNRFNLYCTSLYPTIVVYTLLITILAHFWEMAAEDVAAERVGLLAVENLR